MWFRPPYNNLKLYLSTFKTRLPNFLVDQQPWQSSNRSLLVYQKPWQKLKTYELGTTWGRGLAQCCGSLGTCFRQFGYSFGTVWGQFWAGLNRRDDA